MINSEKPASAEGLEVLAKGPIQTFQISSETLEIFSVISLAGAGAAVLEAEEDLVLKEVLIYVIT